MKYCNRPFEQVYIFPNGDVRACGWTFQKIGNVLENDLYDIWHSEKAEKIRESIKNQSFSSCNKVVCPYCNNNSLVDLDDTELNKIAAADLPVEYNVAIDYICNHSCPSCRHEIFIPDEQYINNINTIIDKLIPYLNQALMISTDGNGDCFASPYIMKMLKNLHPERPEARIILESNGVLCDEEHLNEISHLFDHYVSVTITPNSFDRQTYKYLSGGHDNLEKLLENLVTIKKYRSEKLIDNFEISIVVQDTNYRELPAFVHRCLEDFECDKVVIKPIFYWFCLTPEEYWFKDILNPKHPYFNDYMEVLKDPILQDERVYFWGSHAIHEPKEHPFYDYKRYFDVFARIFECDEPEKLLEKSIMEKASKRVMIYGVNDMAQMMYKLLEKTGIDVTGFIDRDAKVDYFCNLPVTRFDTFSPDMTETVLVSNFAYLTNITRDLKFYNYEGKIIPFDKIID